MRSLVTLALVLGTLALPAAAVAVEAIEEPGGAPAVDSGATGYVAARSAAIGLSVIGFLGAWAALALNAERPDACLQARRLMTMCALVFVLAVLDRPVVQGVAGWFGFPLSDLPPWWR